MFLNYGMLIGSSFTFSTFSVIMMASSIIRSRTDV